MNQTIEQDIAAISRIGAMEMILKVLRRVTGMRISLVARVTSDSWTACAINDEAGFGLKPGDRLDLTTTY